MFAANLESGCSVDGCTAAALYHNQYHQDKDGSRGMLFSSIQHQSTRLKMPLRTVQKNSNQNFLQTCHLERSTKNQIKFGNLLFYPNPNLGAAVLNSFLNWLQALGDSELIVWARIMFEQGHPGRCDLATKSDQADRFNRRLSHTPTDTCTDTSAHPPIHTQAYVTHTSSTECIYEGEFVTSNQRGGRVAPTDDVE